MRMILISLLTLILGISQANAVEFDYEFKSQAEGCTHSNNDEYTGLMQAEQGKLAEVIHGWDDNKTFYHAWAEVAEVQYDGKGDPVDALFIFKSYPNAGILFAYNEGCLIGARVFPLDVVNKILSVYHRMKKKGDL